MAVVLVWDLIFYYLDDFFAVFKELQEIQRFEREFDNVCTNLGKKQLGCLVDFLGLEFETVKIEACLPKDKLKKAIQRVVELLERRSSTTHGKLQYPFFCR